MTAPESGRAAQGADEETHMQELGESLMHIKCRSSTSSFESGLTITKSGAYEEAVQRIGQENQI